MSTHVMIAGTDTVKDAGVVHWRMISATTEEDGNEGTGYEYMINITILNVYVDYPVVFVKVQIQVIGRKCPARSLKVSIRALTNEDLAEERITAFILYLPKRRYFYFQDMLNSMRDRLSLYTLLEGLH